MQYVCTYVRIHTYTCMRVCSAYAHIRLCAYMYVPAYMYIHIESALIICGFWYCEFAYSLKSICNLQVNTSSTFTGHSQVRAEWWKIWVLSQLRLNMMTLCLLVSVIMLYTCPFHGLFNASFSTFLNFLLVISLFKVAPSVVLKFCLVMLTARLWHALGKKHRF